MKAFSKKHDSLPSPPSRQPPPEAWGREALGRVHCMVWERCLHFGSCVCLGLLTAWSIRGIPQAGTRCDCAGRDTSRCLFVRETAIQWDYWQWLKTDRNAFRRCAGVPVGNDNCFCAGWRRQLLLMSSQGSLVPFQVPLQPLLPGDRFCLWTTIPMWKKIVDGKCWMMNVSLIKTTKISEQFFIISKKTSCFHRNGDVDTNWDCEGCCSELQSGQTKSDQFGCDRTKQETWNITMWVLHFLSNLHVKIINSLY